MAVTQRIYPMDELFIACKEFKLMLNDVDFHSVDEVATVGENIMTVYGEDIISMVPSCACGHMNKAFLKGETCSKCGTVVKEISDKVEPFLWMKKLDKRLPFMNPIVWNMLNSTLYSKADIMRWMCDPHYNPPNKIPNWALGIKSIMGERRYFNMIDKLPQIIVYLKNLSNFKNNPSKLENLEYIEYLLTYERNKVYSDYLPIINKNMFVMEKTTKGKFTNLSVSEVIDVVMHWVKVTTPNGPEGQQLTFEVAQKAMTNTLTKIPAMYLDYYSKYLFHKGGGLRKHIFGARLHFTFRAVITSRQGKHFYNQIEAPWCVGVITFRPHILNKLINIHGYTYLEADRLLFKAVKAYDSTISQILDELVAESPYPLGIPVLEARNPGLKQGSVQRKFIVYFKKDPTDYTVGKSNLSATPMNADYDGDQLNYTVLLDNYLADEVSTLDTYYSVPGLGKPCEVSGNLTLDKPANAILTNYMRDNDNGGSNNSLFLDLTGVNYAG